MARIKDLVHEDLASIEECVPNDYDAERRGACRFAAKKNGALKEGMQRRKSPR
jgi:hypothetical protein